MAMPAAASCKLSPSLAARRLMVSWATLNAPNTTVNSKWDFGTRNLAARYDGAFGSSLIVDAAFTYSWNHFTETPQSDVTQIIDSSFAVQPGTFTAQGFGLREPYDSNTIGLCINNGMI